MKARGLMDKPMLPIGVLIFVIFLFNLQRKGYFGESKLKPTSCSALLPLLKRQMPKSSNIFCEKNNLAIETKFQLSKNFKENKPEQILAANYRALANTFSDIARFTHADVLDKVFIVRIKQVSDEYELNAVSEGALVSKLKKMTKPSLISEHLKNTVQVQQKAR